MKVRSRQILYQDSSSKREFDRLKLSVDYGRSGDQMWARCEQLQSEREVTCVKNNFQDLSFETKLNKKLQGVKE